MNTILDVMAEDGFRFKKACSTNNEYKGACPFCGGKDRFCVWPATNKYWCRRCEKAGDSIEYLRQFRGLGYLEACKTLGTTPKKKGALRVIKSLSLSKKKEVEPKAVFEPPTTWQSRAMRLVERANQSLFFLYEMSRDKSKEPADFTLKWLKTRGINPDTARQARLGWNDKTFYEPRGIWNLPIDDRDKVKIPRGLIIPLFSFDRRVIRLRIRQAGSLPYVILAGSDATTPMIWVTGKKFIIIVESELDGLLIHQEAGDIVDVMAIGTAQAKPSHAMLSKAETILISLDYDEAGIKECRWWLKQYRQAQEWPVPEGKDPGEMFKYGYPIREWIELGIEKYSREKEERVEAQRIREEAQARQKQPGQKKERGEPPDAKSQGVHEFPNEWLERFDETTLERLAIMTVDGGLSGTQALKQIMMKDPNKYQG